jgi:hypothetical protein
MPEHPHGRPMTLGNMREMGVRNLIAYCLNDAGAASAFLFFLEARSASIAHRSAKKDSCA